MKILLLTCTILLACAAAAHAEPVGLTAQAKAADAAFLVRAQPPASPAAICLVDTGVDSNPDTSGVIAKLSLLGLDGADASPSRHGTQMAMLMGAPVNEYGMVGFWPTARIVSVQANLPGQDTFTAGTYILGIDECTIQAARYRIKVTVVPVSAELPLTDSERQDLHEALAAARSAGLNVVVAAGNLDGRPLGSPANAPGAFAIGATDATTGALCAISATGADLLAPGCMIDGADPATGAPVIAQQGTSASAAVAATALAALRTWRPDLTPDAAEALLVETADVTSWGPRLNLRAAFAAAGFPQPAEPQPVEPSASPPTTAADAPPAATPVAPTAKPVLAKPRVKARLRKRVLTVRATNRPSGASMVVSVYARRGGKVKRVATRSKRSATIRIRVASWTRIVVRYSDPSGKRAPSPSATVTNRR